MKEEKKLLVFLSMFDLTNAKLEQIRNILASSFSINSFFKSKQIEDALTKDKFDKIKALYDEKRIENYLNKLKNEDISLITIFDEDYPDKLKDLPEAPLFLFCKGDISLLKKPSIGIVGTRKPSNYGRVITDRFARSLAKEGIVIVSGLAYGIDSIAHRKCLEVGGKTIAVLGSGFDEIYPAEHISLAEEIAKKGLLISEYLPNKKATKFSFPQRNRIIAGLSDGLLITEAGIKSGTLHTRDYALDYGKNLYAIPGSIESNLSELTNEMIKTGQAMCVTCCDDILKDYNKIISKNGIKNIAEQLSFEEQNIISLLQDGMKEIDFLAKNCNMSINNFNSYLTTLEIRGIISRLPGGFVILN